MLILDYFRLPDLMKHYLIPENILNEFVSKITKHGDRVTATIKSDKDAKSKKWVMLRAGASITWVYAQRENNLSLSAARVLRESKRGANFRVPQRAPQF